MGEILIKPYEISVWEDTLTQDGFTEKKIAVIGSNTMTGLNKVYDPVFNKKSNGEKTLSFSLKYKYFDPYTGNSDIINPFAALLVNERKVKLYYDNQWYEFIVKDHSESSDGLEWTYTCTDAFVLELSKNGYNITFDTELNNNQGTARELAKETLKDTDWQIGSANIGRQVVAEPIYKAQLVSTSGIDIINTDDNTVCQFETPVDIYLFYSYVKNKNGKFVQFIVHDENRAYTIDDKNVITDTNYRIVTDLTFEDNSFKKESNEIITIDAIETRYQANRLVYGQRTTYDPVLERTVDLFQVDDREIYRYIDYTYTTSNIITNFITNGDNFNVLEDGSLQGWNPYVDFYPHEEGDKIDKLELVTRPELGTNKELADLTLLSQIEGFLKVQLKGALTNDYKNAVFNSGIENNSSIIESVSKGQRFVFRWRAGIGNINTLQPMQNLGLIVAKYTQDEPNPYRNYYKHIDPNNIILRFQGEPTPLNNYVRGGELVEGEDGKLVYVIDDVVQTPSTKYIYEVVEVEDGHEQTKEYIWNGLRGEFELKNSSNYLPYYYLTATANQAIKNSDLSDPTQKFGIFVYATDSSSPIYIQDIQLTRFIEDANGQPILMGNIPTATSSQTSYYYLKPSDGAAAEDVETYTSLDELANDLGVSPTDIKPVYNEDSEKILSISVSQSNCFNILQTIAETFECWVDLKVVHDARGYIQYDEDGRPQKYVYLNEYAGKDNWAGFKYGINLDTIERTINSEEFVTKLIVDSSQSDYVDEGFVSIMNAPSNQSGESYILNFDYYYNQGLLDRDAAEADRLEFIAAVAEKNTELQEKEAQRRNLESALTGLGSNRNVFTELVETAKDTQTRALAEFEALTGQTYEDYKAIHTSLEEDKQLTEEDTIFDLLGELYVSSAAINNYSGILSNVDQEYWTIRKQLRGSENYNVKVWTGIDDNQHRHVFVELNDFLPDFSFEIGDSTYTSTVSKKYWDLEKDDTVITFMAPSGYSVEQSQYTIIDNKVGKFKITSSESVEGVEDEIEKLQEQKDELINDFNNKYRRFIQEGTWNSTDYIDSELYYLDALQVSNTSAQPAVSYTINVVEVSELEGLEQYLFDAGDKTYVEDTEFFGWTKVNGVLTPAREEVIVSEVEWHLDEPDKNVITVQNYKTRFEDLFQRISAAVQTVQYNEATYAKISSLLDANGTINQDVLLESLNRIGGKEYNLTSDGSVLINGDQILIQNLTNPANRVIINSEGIRVSSDGGQNWQTAIDGEGINIGTVYTGTLNTNQVVIGSDDNPSFRWDKAGISAFKSNEETGIYDLQTFVRYDQYGLYGVKNNGAFKAQSLDDVLEKAHFAVTWDGFFIKNNYEDGGRVSITSDNDFQVIDGSDTERIKIGSLGIDQITGDRIYGINIKDKNGNSVLSTNNDGDLTISGTIYANAGEIGGMSVDSDRLKMDYIVFRPGTGIYSIYPNHEENVNNPISAYPFWIKDTDGSAIFNNVTVRGSIKTSVFEYEEIQAVGGAFMFRPSTAIRSARVDGNDLVITVDKPGIIRNGAWYKLSNYTGESSDVGAYGLVHIYQISTANNQIKLLGGAAVLDVADINDIAGGSIIDMGYEANHALYNNGKDNYGIGINSSDNFINLPPRAISLFETKVDHTQDPKVEYIYRAILGTLPDERINNLSVDANIYQHMRDTQGIYTDNMYIGDANSYLAFYTENNQKRMQISGADIVFTYNAGGQTRTGDIDDVIQHIEVEGGEGLILIITSSNGTQFNTSAINTTLTATVYKNGEVISDISSLGILNWYIESINSVYIGTNDITVDITKTYYKYNSITNNYEEVVNPTDVDIENYYERKNQTTGTECKVGAIDIANIVVKLEDISELGG